MTSTVPNRQVQLLLEILDQAYDKKAWHGTNLRGSVRRVTAEEASWRPGLGRHTICEVVMHAAYWKYAVRRRLTGEKRGSFPMKGSNWFRHPVPLTEDAWRSVVKLLDEEHGRLRECLSHLSERQLRRRGKGSRYSNATLMYGIASHDLYHAGQIQLLKRLTARVSHHIS